MHPTKSPTEAEYKVIRWFFGPLLIVAFIVIAWLWYARSHECTASCRAQAFKSGVLHFNSGSKLNAGTHCECSNE